MVASAAAAAIIRPAMTDERKLPTGRLGRWVRLAGAGARAGASVLLGKGDDEAALRAAEMLGTLRGLAAKLGQMASYVDGLLPEEQRDRYERALRADPAAAGGDAGALSWRLPSARS